LEANHPTYTAKYAWSVDRLLLHEVSKLYSTWCLIENGGHGA